MKINGTPHQGSVHRPDASSPRASDAKAERTKAHAPSARESVAVSQMGRALALARAAEAPDAERIGRLRSALESGKLAVDSGAIADAMLREER